MLYFKDFEQAPNLRRFEFDKLQFISEGSTGGTYSDDYGNHYLVLKYGNISHPQLIDELHSKGVILNYKGTLAKGSVFFVFAILDEYLSLNSMVGFNQHEKKLIDEKLCIELIETMLMIFLEMQKTYNCHLKILTPSTIGIRNINEKESKGFGLLLPFPHEAFNRLDRVEVKDNYYFAAPEIISHFENNECKVAEKEFRKACLFSLGLVLLFCFGHCSLNYLKVREFRNYFKNIRRQIKVLHKGKFVPKVLKLMLESCEKSRDNLDTFNIKIHSTQFESLKVSTFNVLQSIKMTTLLTRSDKSNPKMFKTISINGSHDSSLMITDKSIDKTFREEHSSKTQKIIPHVDSPIDIYLPSDDEEKQEEKKEIHEEPFPEMQMKKDESMVKMEEDLGDDIYKYNPDQLTVVQREQECTVDQNFEIFPEVENSEPELNPYEEEFSHKSKLIFGVTALCCLAYGVTGYL